MMPAGILAHGNLHRTTLFPLNIGAMLDAPIRRKGQVVGVLCNEHVGGAKIVVGRRRKLCLLFGHDGHAGDGSR